MPERLSTYLTAERDEVDRALRLYTWNIEVSSAFWGPLQAVELSFGFWTGLLGRGNAYEHRLWIPALRHAFPNYRGSRTHLHGVAESLRLLRNRIAHHEPVFDRHLAADHASILKLAGYLDDDVRGWIDSQSRVSEVLSRRGQCVVKGVNTSF